MKKVRVEIPEGDAGIDATVGAMWRLIRRDVSDPLITKTIKPLKKDDCEATAKAVYDFVIGKFKYKNDPEGIELIAAPVNMLNGNVTKGDCDDLTTVLCCLLAAATVPVRIKVIAWRKQEFTHVIGEYNCSGEWIPIDPVRGSGGFGHTITKIIRSKVYTDSVMSRPLVTLEDAPISKPCCSKGRGGNVNNNTININTLPANQGKFVSSVPSSGNYVSSIQNPASQTPAASPQEIIKYYPINQKVPTPYPQQTIIKQPVPVPVTKTLVLPASVDVPPQATLYKEFY